MLVEGSGGLLVRLDSRGGTLADVGTALRYRGTSCGVLLVARAGLGTLNHTALTLEALGSKGLSCAGLIIGSWPAQPGAAEVSNRGALQRLAPVRAALPAGAGTLSPTDFAALSVPAFDADWVAGLAC